MSKFKSFVCRNCHPPCYKEAANLSKDESKQCQMDRGIVAMFVRVL